MTNIVVSISSLTSDSTFVGTGAFLLGGAIALGRSLSNDFANQAALAISLAGQGLLAYGMVLLLDGAGAELVLWLVMAVNAPLILLLPDVVHRIFSVLAITGAAVGLLYLESMQELLPFLSPALALALVLLLVNEERWRGSRHAPLAQALVPGLSLAAFGSVINISAKTN